MTPEQMEFYRSVAVAVPTLYLNDIGEHDRTLAYGYTVDRNTWHAYVMSKSIHVLIFDHNKEVLFYKNYGRHAPAVELTPSKRVYPDTVDLGFALKMRDLDSPLPFTTFDSSGTELRAANGIYKGKVHFDLDIFPEVD